MVRIGSTACGPMAGLTSTAPVTTPTGLTNTTPCRPSWATPATPAHPSASGVGRREVVDSH